MINVDQLSLSLSGLPLLENLSFVIPEGAIFAILGPNGAGKTLLLRCLAELIVPSRGTIHSATQSRAWVPLSQALPFDMKVFDLVAMGRFKTHQGFVQASDREAVEAALERLSIKALSGRSYNTLSRGEQTKVDIARALASDAKLILLDEPFSNLDIDSSLHLIATLHDLRRAGKTFVLSHHDLFTTQELATHALLLKKGRLLKAGTLTEVFTPENIAAAYNVTAALLNHEQGRFVRFDKQ